MAGVIREQRNGPYIVVGPVILMIKDEKVEVKEGETLYLCRCANSKRQPYCDGGCKVIGFEIEGESEEDSQSS
jgi:CDGSH-type Zn-finger protein